MNALIDGLKYRNCSQPSPFHVVTAVRSSICRFKSASAANAEEVLPFRKMKKTNAAAHAKRV